MRNAILLVGILATLILAGSDPLGKAEFLLGFRIEQHQHNSHRFAIGLADVSVLDDQVIQTRFNSTATAKGVGFILDGIVGYEIFKQRHF